DWGVLRLARSSGWCGAGDWARNIGGNGLARGRREGDRRPDEPGEERMRPVGPAAELGMELAGHEPGVVLQLDDLDEAAVRRLAGHDHARGLERRTVVVLHLEAVAMALVDDLLTVRLGRLRAGREAGRVEAQAHRAALLLHLALVGHEVDDRMLREQVELGRVGPLGTEDVAGELDDPALEAEAEAEIGQLLFAGVARGEDLALDPAVAELARVVAAGGAAE